MLSDFQYCIQLMLKNQVNIKTHPKNFNDKYHDFHCIFVFSKNYLCAQEVVFVYQCPAGDSRLFIYGVGLKNSICKILCYYKRIHESNKCTYRTILLLLLLLLLCKTIAQT